MIIRSINHSHEKLYRHFEKLQSLWTDMTQSSYDRHADSFNNSFYPCLSPNFSRVDLHFLRRYTRAKMRFHLFSLAVGEESQWVSPQNWFFAANASLLSFKNLTLSFNEPTHLPSIIYRFVRHIITCKHPWLLSQTENDPPSDILPLYYFHLILFSSRIALSLQSSRNWDSELKSRPPR